MTPQGSQTQLHLKVPKPNYTSRSPNQIALQGLQTQLHFKIPKPKYTSRFQNQITPQGAQTQLYLKVHKPNCTLRSQTQLTHNFTFVLSHAARVINGNHDLVVHFAGLAPPQPDPVVLVMAGNVRDQTSDVETLA